MNEALRYAFRLLKFRPRSEYELHQRLKRRGFSESLIKEATLFLKEKGLVNDLEFARVWVESRIKKPLGINRLRQELKIKGIDKELISKVIDNISIRYREDETVRDLTYRRWERLKHIPPHKAKQRIYLYLLRRGFSSNMIREVINQL